MCITQENFILFIYYVFEKNTQMLDAMELGTATE